MTMTTVSSTSTSPWNERLCDADRSFDDVREAAEERSKGLSTIATDMFTLFVASVPIATDDACDFVGHGYTFVVEREPPRTLR